MMSSARRGGVRLVRKVDLTERRGPFGRSRASKLRLLSVRVILKIMLDLSSRVMPMEREQGKECSRATVRLSSCSTETISSQADHDKRIDILGHGTAVFENLSLYISSLRKMSTFFNAGGPAYPGHGLVVPDGRAKIEEYIKHRQQREDEVLKVLKTGSLDADVAASAAGESLTPMQLVKVIYWNVPEALHLPAARGVGLILEKLEAEGKVVRVDEGGEELWKVSEGRGKASAL